MQIKKYFSELHERTTSRRQVASYEYPKHMFLWRNKNNTCIDSFWLKKTTLSRAMYPAI